MEIMVAVVLLAICAVPMMDAVRNGIGAAGIAETRARELRCIKNTMETVLAMPYQTLWNAAPGPGPAAGLALPADAACASAPLVSVLRYEYDAGSKTLAPLPATASGDRLESPLLYITVAASGGYSFTTLVAR